MFIDLAEKPSRSQIRAPKGVPLSSSSSSKMMTEEGKKKEEPAEEDESACSTSWQTQGVDQANSTTKCPPTLHTGIITSAKWNTSEAEFSSPHLGTRSQCNCVHLIAHRISPPFPYFWEAHLYSLWSVITAASRGGSCNLPHRNTIEAWKLTITELRKSRST